jgi:glycosyltransferase involved in cell wall biosynthesis
VVLRLALVSNALDPPVDEGIKKFARDLGDALSREEALIVSIERNESLVARKLFLSRRLGAALREGGVSVAVYVPTQSATLASLVRAALLRAKSGAKVILVAMQPRQLSSLGRLLARRLAPDLILTPSEEVLAYWESLGVNASFLPVGIDTERFRPVGGAEKAALRAAHGLPDQAFVVLHVGHVRPLRNLDWVAAVRKHLKCEAIVVGSVSMGSDREVARRMTDSGVRIKNEYLPRIEELYQLADCYLFPVREEMAAVGIPLSVLEAMACNLPVVSTRFGGLPRLFPEGGGLSYADDEAEFKEKVRVGREAHPGKKRTREMVLPYSWDAIARLVREKAEELV